jgi:hypothetical protein
LTKEFGDFQTPPGLVAEVLACLTKNGEIWTRALEPTCGKGNFINGLLSLEHSPEEVCAFEIQADHVTTARETATKLPTTQVDIWHTNLFEVDLRRDLKWDKTGPLLVIGNPPWVTNSQLSVLASNNVPIKTNLKKLRGIEAMTGGSNFDIAEFIWLKLLQELADEQPTIALLCKTSVARNVLQFAVQTSLPIRSASIHKIDAKKWFGVAVDACLFRVDVAQGEARYEANVYRNLQETVPEATIGFINGHLVSDTNKYDQSVFADGVCTLTWRQGLKHDAASIMELANDAAGEFQNKLGEQVLVERDYIYPLLKSSDLQQAVIAEPRRAVIVTQHRLGEDTQQLEHQAPRLWNYLSIHAEVFERRKSSIYKGHSSYAMFGIGDYSFAPYKVAISGMYKLPKFCLIQPIAHRPVMLDDTCYFVACSSREQAALLTCLLNHPTTLTLIAAISFTDTKRPITKKILQRLNLVALLDSIGQEPLLAQADKLLRQLGVTNVEWPHSLNQFFIDQSNTSKISNRPTQLTLY